MKATRKDAVKLMQEGVLALAAVEHNGMRVDVNYLRETEESVSNRIKKIEAKLRSDKVFKVWKKRFGQKTKLGSREQLGTVLFDVLKIDGGELTEKSKVPGAKERWKVDEEILQDIDLPFVKGFLRVEKLKKLLATNLKGISRELCGQFVRPFQNLHIPRSFRSSQDSFNGQNIPTRDEMLAKIIRPVFIPRKGCILTEFDFKGAEVCGAASITKDPNLIRYVTDPKRDMHRDTAAQIFGLKKSEISKMARNEVKPDFVFAQFYGAWYKTCAPRIWKAMERFNISTEDGTRTLFEVLEEQGITELGDCDPQNNDRPEEDTFAHRVREVEKDFWERRFRVYKDWKDTFYEKYLERGYFDMVTGFRCTGVYTKKQVCNYPIQGPAFHCLLWVLTRLNEWLRKYKMRSLIIGQIHDSMLVDIWLDELQDVIDKVQHLVKVELPKAWPWIRVPLVIEVEGSDQNWYLKRPIEEMGL